MLQLITPNPPRSLSRGRHLARVAVRTARTAVAVSEAGYAAVVARNWWRYGRLAAAQGDDVDPLLDGVMPSYDIAERHHIRVEAPVDVTLAAAGEISLDASVLVRLVFKARAFVLGTRVEATQPSRGLLAQMKAIGWETLAADEGREIVMGAVTQPWQADVVFRGMPATEFLAFNEPGYVKIAWNLRADAVDGTSSIFRTETRVATTDAGARRRFRWYWAKFSPGIVLIRRMLLHSIKAEAERRAGATR